MSPHPKTQWCLPLRLLEANLKVLSEILVFRSMSVTCVPSCRDEAILRALRKDPGAPISNYPLTANLGLGPVSTPRSFNSQPRVTRPPFGEMATTRAPRQATGKWQGTESPKVSPNTRLRASKAQLSYRAVDTGDLPAAVTSFPTSKAIAHWKRKNNFF